MILRTWQNPWRLMLAVNAAVQFGSSPTPYIETHAAWIQAQRAARQCDLMLVAGSSLEVLPVAGLPMQALDRGAHLIVVNNTPTYVNVRADVVILSDVASVLPEITKRVVHG